MGTDTVVLAVMGLLVVIILTDILFALYLVRLERERGLAEIARLEGLHAGERDRLGARVQYLEFQLANHVAHVLKLPPPAPPLANGPQPEPLPEVVQKFLDAIDDAEARVEYEGDFRARLALGADPHQLVAEAMSA